MMVNKILVATDGSEPSTDAIKYAFPVAKALGAGVVALTVISEAQYTHWLSVKERHLQELQEEAERIVEDAKKLGKEKGLKVEGVIRRGLPHEEIIKYAKENHDIVMVILGASGKDFATRRLVGSVTEKVVQEASKELPCPVIVIPRKEKISSARTTTKE